MTIRGNWYYIFVLATLLPAACAPAAKTPAAPPQSLWQGQTYNGAYAIQVDHPIALVDAPLVIRVSGLQPGQPVTLRVSMALGARVWEAWATFTADSSGIVDLTRAAPTHGTYTGADGMGLFWSMAPARTVPTEGDTARSPAAPLIVTLTIEAAGRTLAEAQVERLFYDEAQVARLPVAGGKIVGTLFVPTTAGPHPAVVVLPGSEGGVPQGQAALLASHGFAALALAYFGVEGLPAQLVEIPLEYARGALDWLAAQPEVDGGRIAVMGGSKGAELALLLAATYPDAVRAVVAFKPSSVVWMGLPANPADNFRGPKSSWTLAGRPLPFVSGAFTLDLLKPMLRQPSALVSSYVGGLKNAGAVAAATIPVERIRGPVLLVSGAQDQLWPSTQMAAAIIKRLDEHRFPYRHEHLAYGDAGHGLTLPYLPTTTINSGTILAGGTPQGTAAANADAWPKAVGFLREELR